MPWRKPLFYGLNILGKCFFNTFGYKNLNDFLGSFPEITNKSVLISVFVVSMVASLVDAFFGIPTRLALVLVCTLIFEFLMGVIVNVFIFKEDFQERKALRFIFKNFVYLITLSLVHSIKQGFMLMQMSETARLVVGSSFEFLYIFVLLMLFYITMAGASKSGDKAGWRFFTILYRFFTFKIKQLEGKAGQ